MIDCKLVKSNPRAVRLKISGHAGTALKGSDLVCEDVTALWYTLLATAEEHGWKGTVRTDEGDCEIEVELSRQNRKEVMLCLSVITAGLKMVARTFPLFVRYTEDDGSAGASA